MTDQDTPGDEPPSRSPTSHGLASDGSPRATTRSTEIDVIDATSRTGQSVRIELAERLSVACSELGATGEVRVKIVGDAEMSRLHGEHKGDATTTDVLTFDLSGRGEGDRAGPLDIDLVVCLDEAERQAATRGHAVGLELLLYSVHGVLHCVGFDDGDDASAARMHAEEDRVLRAIGVGAVYARPEVEQRGTGAAI